MDPLLNFGLRCSLALLFIWSAVHKLRDRNGFRAALDAYDLLPAPLVALAGFLIPATELALAAALVTGGASAWPALASAALLALYTAAILINIVRGRTDIDCGCGGPSNRQPLGIGLVIRNLGLITMALTAMLPMDSRPLVWLDAFTLAAWLIAASLLYGATNRAIANAFISRTTPKIEHQE